MRIWLFTGLCFTFLFGCHRPLPAPENADPIYTDLQTQLTHSLADVHRLQKDLEKDKTDYENAPIRTGQRQDAQEVYFQAQHAYQKAIEVYRYLSVKLRQLKDDDRSSYAKAFKESKPWPDPESYSAYLLDKKLASAPREWDPDAKLKARAPASKKEKEPSEGSAEP